MTTYIVELQITPAEGSKPPGEWFWTDACDGPDDHISVVRVEEVEG
jgi:hypothetical protein